LKKLSSQDDRIIEELRESNYDEPTQNDIDDQIEIEDIPSRLSVPS
jgi:hypothetical protein